MAVYTIRNDFHGTSATVRVGESGLLSPGQIKRVRKALCGIDGCTCGGPLSERGPQECAVEFAGCRNWVDVYAIRPIRELA
jgi:hypothetical protein